MHMDADLDHIKQADGSSNNHPGIGNNAKDGGYGQKSHSVGACTVGCFIIFNRSHQFPDGKHNGRTDKTSNRHGNGHHDDGIKPVGDTPWLP